MTENDSPRKKNNLFLDEGIFCPLDLHTRKLNMLEARNIGGYWVDTFVFFV